MSKIRIRPLKTSPYITLNVFRKISLIAECKGEYYIIKVKTKQIKITSKPPVPLSPGVPAAPGGPYVRITQNARLKKIEENRSILQCWWKQNVS